MLNESRTIKDALVSALNESTNKQTDDLDKKIQSVIKKSYFAFDDTDKAKKCAELFDGKLEDVTLDDDQVKIVIPSDDNRAWYESVIAKEAIKPGSEYIGHKSIVVKDGKKFTEFPFSAKSFQVVFQYGGEKATFAPTKNMVINLLDINAMIDDDENSSFEGEARMASKARKLLGVKEKTNDLHLWFDENSHFEMAE